MKAAVPSTKTDFVYQTLRDEIHGGQLHPGQRLRLSEIAARYEISEMPVREALRKLEHDGLVEFENHRGATVSNLNLARVVEIISARTHLEVLAVCEAAPHHTAATLERLGALTEKMRKVSNPAEYSDLNRRFHKLLYDPCPNAFLKSEIDNLWDKVWRTHSHSVFELLPERVDGASDEHEDIVKAIKAGSAAAVEKAARKHREHTLQGWRNLARQAGPRDEPTSRRRAPARAPATPRPRR
jgi:DNA-binding GntR family transcriptional regulator